MNRTQNMALFFLFLFFGFHLSLPLKADDDDALETAAIVAGSVAAAGVGTAALVGAGFAGKEIYSRVKSNSDTPEPVIDSDSSGEKGATTSLNQATNSQTAVSSKGALVAQQSIFSKAAGQALLKAPQATKQLIQDMEKVNLLPEEMAERVKNAALADRVSEKQVYKILNQYDRDVYQSIQDDNLVARADEVKEQIDNYRTLLKESENRVGNLAERTSIDVKLKRLEDEKKEIDKRLGSFDAYQATLVGDENNRQSLTADQQKKISSFVDGLQKTSSVDAKNFEKNFLSFLDKNDIPRYQAEQLVASQLQDKTVGAFKEKSDQLGEKITSTVQLRDSKLEQVKKLSGSLSLLPREVTSSDGKIIKNKDIPAYIKTLEKEIVALDGDRVALEEEKKSIDTSIDTLSKITADTQTRARTINSNQEEVRKVVEGQRNSLINNAVGDLFKTYSGEMTQEDMKNKLQELRLAGVPDKNIAAMFDNQKEILLRAKDELEKELANEKDPEKAQVLKDEVNKAKGALSFVETTRPIFDDSSTPVKKAVKSAPAAVQGPIASYALKPSVAQAAQKTWAQPSTTPNAVQEGIKKSSLGDRFRNLFSLSPNKKGFTQEAVASEQPAPEPEKPASPVAPEQAPAPSTQKQGGPAGDRMWSMPIQERGFDVPVPVGKK